MFLADNAGSAAGGAVIALISLALAVVAVAAQWKVFVKAGRPGWACLIPIYNIYVMCKIAGKPGWWILLMVVPIVQIVVAVLVSVGIAQRFGRGTGFAVGMVFLPFIFWCILGFGDATYRTESAI